MYTYSYKQVSMHFHIVICDTTLVLHYHLTMQCPSIPSPWLIQLIAFTICKSDTINLIQ